MKKVYCLDDKGKSDALNLLKSLGMVVLMVYIVFSVIAMILILGDVSEETVNLQTAILIAGNIGWAAMISFLIIGFKRWLQDHIVRCN